MKKTIIILSLVALVLASCATTKNGCGSYNKWEAKHSFNK